MTAAGARSEAERVVVATQLPFLDRGLFFARAHAQRSYAISVRLSGEVPQGMYLQAERPGRSLRAHPWEGEELLIVGGESHELGHGDPVEKFHGAGALRARALRASPASSIAGPRTTSCPTTGFPTSAGCGRSRSASRRLTGLRKWGLAMGAAAGGCSPIGSPGAPNEWAARFDPRRLPPLSAMPALVKHNADTGLHFFADRAKRGRLGR